MRIYVSTTGAIDPNTWMSIGGVCTDDLAGFRTWMKDNCPSSEFIRIQERVVEENRPWTHKVVFTFPVDEERFHFIETWGRHREKAANK